MESYQERLNKLNDQQRLAVETIEGPVLVVAGPGSGKTELLSLRVANILLQTDVSPSNILCLTFTDAAATNMRRRLAGLLGQEAYRVAIHTFHNFGTQIISRHAEHFYGGATFAPADDIARIELLEEIFEGMAHDNPLRSLHPEQGFVYLKPAQGAIESLKKAGLTPAEFAAILEANEGVMKYSADLFHPIFDGTVNLKQLDQIVQLITDLRNYPAEGFPVPHFEPLSLSLAQSLEDALLSCRSVGKATPLSEWKKSYLEKDVQGRRVLRDVGRLAKMKALAAVYATYQDELYKRGYIDYADMLLSTIQAMESNDSLRLELQEQYQYLMVDEFQDTNDAQMRLLQLLADAEVNEGRPNLMVVGDDDQAIYKFQGAEIKNITGFTRGIRDPQIITLTKNYRSTQEILDVARTIITQGVDRLENILPEVQKVLTAANASLEKGAIHCKALPTAAHEYYWVAQEIKRLVEEGHEPQEIAVITRKHASLEELTPYLHQAGVPVRYERQQDVLQQSHIRQLIQVSRYLCTLGRKNKMAADELLPEILSYPYWGLSRLAIWKLSTQAYAEHKLWIDCMLESQDRSLVALATYFIDLAARSQVEPLEYLLEALIGAHTLLTVEDETEDEEGVARPLPGFVSPFKEYYFGKARFVENQHQYLVFLSSLKVFVTALHEYRLGQPLKLEDLVTYVEVHEKNGISLTDTSSFMNAAAAVQLMSAHTAKGLEFETVFVLSCQDDIWAKSGGSSKMSFPLNLPISPAGDTDDDKLRLFYVALTRAKRYLYLTSYEKKDNGKESLRLQFLAGLPELAAVKLVAEELPEPTLILAASWDAFHRPPFIQEEKALLLPILESYQMSVTHLNTYLDVTKGPRIFLEENLLRFPHPKSLSSSYGSAVHEAIHQLYLGFKAGGTLPGRAWFLAAFEKELLKQRLGESDFAFWRSKGEASLTVFYEQNLVNFDLSHESEINFNHQEVHLGEAHITGKIDKIIKVGVSEISVHDFKTGKATNSWDGSSAWEKLKLSNYRRQLLFYKLLIEHSRDFSGKYVVRTGALEFVEPQAGQLLQLDMALDTEAAERLARLAEIVYAKIRQLDFPDVSHYSQDVAGVAQFEEDLLAGTI